MTGADVRLVLLGALAVLVAALVLGEAKRDRRWTWATKPLASVTFVALAFAGEATATGFGRFMLVGLAFAAVGDVLLIPDDRRVFRAGILAFLLAHLVYGAAFATLGLHRTWAVAAGVVLVLAALSLVPRLLGDRVPAALRGAVRGYVYAISAMVLLAAGAVGAGASPLVLAGAVAFYVSDVLVARDRFVGHAAWHRVVGLPLYYGAQAAFAWVAAAP